MSARRGEFSERRRMESNDRRETAPIRCRVVSLDRGDPQDGPPRFGARPCLTPNSAFSGLTPYRLPLGEGGFRFATPGGRVWLSVTSDALTPFGGLVPWTAYTKHLGIIDALAADCPVRRTSPNAAPVYDVLQSFMLTVLTAGRRFSQEMFNERPRKIFGWKSPPQCFHEVKLYQKYVHVQP